MRRTAIVVNTLILLTFAAPCPIAASWPYVRILHDPNDWLCDCRLPDTAPQIGKMYVVVSAWDGITGVQFAAPMPTCMTGATYLSDEWVYPVSLGDSQTGIAIGWSSCETGMVHVLTINYYMQGLSDCCRYRVVPDPRNPNHRIELWDCDSNLVIGGGGVGLVSNWFGTKFENRTPPDGAIDQPLDTDLFCTVRYCSCNSQPYVWIYFGTTPDPPAVAADVPFPYDPGPLQPKTTYYWKLRDAEIGMTTPVWSFTTGKGVPTQRTSWGAIKALFGE